MSLLASRGRGSRFTLRRGIVETALRAAYVGDWPARAWARVPGACEIRIVRRELAALRTSDTPRVRVGFASDLHLGPTTPDALVRAAEAALARAKLDVLLLGGDYVFLDATAAKAERLAAFVRRVGARRTFAVMGNHDLWTDHPLLERALRGAGAVVLENEGLHVPEHPDVWIAGIDDPWTGRPDAARAFAGSHARDVRIALCHAPEGLFEVAPHAPALLLVGHTHGGHVALPGGIPIVVPGPLGRAHPSGWYQVGTTTLGVSRGVGGVELALRAFAPPDVVLVDLVPVRTPSRS